MGKKGDNIKKPKADSGKKIGLSESNKPHHIFDYPTFCFKYLHKNHSLEQCDEAEKARLMERLVLLSSFNWGQIQHMPKNTYGSEKIDITAIKPSIPISFSQDVTFLLSLRFDAQKPIVGHRGLNNVFHVLYIDNKFSVYQH